MGDKLRWSGDFMWSEVLGIPYELPEEEDFAVGHYTLTDFPNINLYINVETGKFIEVWLDEEE